MIERLNPFKIIDKLEQQMYLLIRSLSIKVVEELAVTETQ